MSSHPMDFTDETEDTLLGYMAMQWDDPDAARSAWDELYRRHHRYFLAVFGRTHAKDLGGPDGVADLTIEAFRELFEWAGRQPDPNALIAKFAASTQDGIRRRVLGYITRIAERILIDRLRGVQEQSHWSHLDDEHWEREWQWRADNPVPQPSPAALALYEQALELLSEREAEVLRLSLPWYDPDKGDDGEFDFPRDEAERVAASIGTTPENFRQIRSRAIRRVRAAHEREVLAPASKGDAR